MKSKEQHITLKDFGYLFVSPLSDGLRKSVQDADLRYRDLTAEEWREQEQWIQNLINDPRTDPSSEERHPIWEKGWGENLEALRNGDDHALIPGYFEKQQEYAAWHGKIVRICSPNFSYRLLDINMRWLLETYATNVRAIYEFGCGTGHHLLRAHVVNPAAKLYGLDWAAASQGILREMDERGILPGVTGRRFDFFKPDKTFELERKSMVYTIAALEQVGTQHEKFVDYLLAQRPEICCNLEPIPESLDEKNLLDRWSKVYYTKRNYLDGFLTRLRELEASGKLTIEKAVPTYVGNYFSGYMTIVWRPR